MQIKVKVKKLTETAHIPAYATLNSACTDLYADIQEDVVIPSGETKLISTGLAMEIPQGYVGMIYPRSGLATKQGLNLANCTGIIDADYRGTVGVALHNHSKEDRVIKSGDRIAQFMIMPYPSIEYEEVDELDSTERGEGGFGSTGK